MSKVKDVNWLLKVWCFIDHQPQTPDKLVDILIMVEVDEDLSVQISLLHSTTQTEYCIT